MPLYQVVERALTALSEKAIVIRLSGHAQTNDRLAMREIAWQLATQCGSAFLPLEDVDAVDEDAAENPFLDRNQPHISLPPPSHLLALISMIPMLPHPTVIVLDAFDLFACMPDKDYCTVYLTPYNVAELVKEAKGWPWLA